MTTKNKIIFGLFLAVTLVFQTTEALAVGGSVFIDTNGNGILDTGEQSFSTISAAITAASVGNTIVVTAGTYTESVNDTKGVILQASGSDRSATIVGKVTLNALGSKIRGFTVTNPTGNFGILINGFGNTEVSNNTVTNVGISAVTLNSFGIYFQDNNASAADNIKIQNNTVNTIGSVGNSGFSSGGIGIGDSDGNENLTNVIISGNIISGVTAKNTSFGTGGRGAYGIVLNHATHTSSLKMGSTIGAQVTGNTISNLNGEWSHGIGLEGDTPNAVVTGNLISNLVASFADASAIHFDDDASSASVTIQNNTFDTTSVTFGVVSTIPTNVNASQNYWNTGATDPTPKVATTSTGTIIVSPWYRDASMTTFKTQTTPSGTGVSSTLVSSIIATTSTLAGAVSQVIPAGVLVTGSSGWDGTLAAPFVPSTFTLTPDSGNTAEAVSAIEVGAGDIPLTFNQPAKLTFTGLAGKLTGWSQAGVFHQITATCDSSTAPTLVSGADCKIDVGGDLVVWTKHFTTFVTYTQTPSAASGSSGTNQLQDGTINVVKVVINDNGGTKTIADFPLFVNGMPVVSGVTNSFSSQTYLVSETVDSHYTQSFSGDCTFDGHIGLNRGENKVCIITNDDIGTTVVVPSPLPLPVPALIDVVNVPSPLVLPGGPGPVTYTYTLRNTGIVPITNISMIGDTCSSITLISGDTNSDAKLDINETWVYTCQTNLTKTTTNTVTAIGWTNGISGVDIANATVVVGVPGLPNAGVLPPLIHVTKVPSPVALGSGGGMVTYTNKVTNPGIAALSNVRLTDDRCDHVNYMYGDTNTNSKLDTTETWTYTCRTNLTKTTTNIVVAEGTADGFLARDFGIVTVIVASPSLPSTGFKMIQTNLGRGSGGNNVTTLQQFLILQNMGPSAKALAGAGATAYFGGLTRAALAEFQMGVGIIPASGNFGPITRAYLNAHY